MLWFRRSRSIAFMWLFYLKYWRAFFTLWSTFPTHEASSVWLVIRSISSSALYSWTHHQKAALNVYSSCVMVFVITTALLSRFDEKTQTTANSFPGRGVGRVVLVRRWCDIVQATYRNGQTEWRVHAPSDALLISFFFRHPGKFCAWPQ